MLCNPSLPGTNQRGRQSICAGHVLSSTNLRPSDTSREGPPPRDFSSLTSTQYFRGARLEWSDKSSPIELQLHISGPGYAKSGREKTEYSWYILGEYS